ncbi:extracellular with a signal peptide [Cryptosporidium xiaoi]|uniref:Extracellular with a signal peptide n=1 Tax=Cryptosporidium xiaoi TaxID=659607 RepID=A0AAV9XUW2_9CRYT
MNNLIIHSFLLLIKLIYASKEDQKIILSVYMGNENDVKELITLKNDRFLPINVTTELELDKYELNDIEDYCCYYNKHESNLDSKSENEIQLFSTDYKLNENIRKELYVYGSCKIDNIETQQNIRRNMIRFYDYEYDPSRPIELSPKDMDIWRNKFYNKIKLENITVPGKGTGRLFVKVNTNGFLKGNYHFSLKIIQNDNIETKNVIIIVKEYPFEVGVKLNNYLLKNADSPVNESNSFEVVIKNNLIFESIKNVEMYLVTDINKRISCKSIDMQLLGFPSTFQIIPGKKVELETKCGKNEDEIMMIKRSRTLELIIIGSIYNRGRDTKYRRSFNLFKETHWIKGTSEEIVLLSSMNNNLENKYGETDYNFKNMNRKTKERKHLNKYETETVILTEKNLENEIIITKVGILVDLNDLFNDIFNLSDINIVFSISEIHGYSFFKTYFENRSKELIINNIQTITKQNSIICLELVVKINKQALMKVIFEIKNFIFTIPITIKVTQNKQETEPFVKMIDYKFQIDFKLKDCCIYKGNIIKSEANTDKLMISVDEKTLRLDILKLSDLNVNFKDKTTKIELIHQNSDGTVLEKKLLENFKIDKYDKLELSIRMDKYIDENVIRNNQIAPCVEDYVFDLPYKLLINENKFFQIATTYRCVKIDIEDENIDFGIIPVSISGNNQILGSIEIEISKEEKYSSCFGKIWLGFSLTSTYTLELLFKENENEVKKVNFFHNNQDSELNTYIFQIDLEKIGSYSLVVYSNFGDSKVKIETGKTLDVSAILRIYSNRGMVNYLNGINSVILEGGIIRDEEDIKKINMDKLRILENNIKVPKHLFLFKSVTIKCIIRSLDVRISPVKIITPPNSSYFSKETIEMRKLPLSFMLVDLTNNEKFPIQYSVQKDESFMRNSMRVSEYIKENYAIYVEYKKDLVNNMKTTVIKSEREFELIKNTVYQDYLAFNFPYKDLFLKRVEFDYNTGSLLIFDENTEKSLVIRLISEKIKNLYKSVFIYFGHNGINSWKITLIFKDKYLKEIITSNFKIYETGKMAWFLESNESYLNKEVFGSFTPVFFDYISLDNGFKLDKIFDKSKLKRAINISIVPWIEISKDTSRTGYLLPNEKRVIPILIHNQIVTSSSSKSRLKDLACDYNLVFKGLVEINKERNGKPLYGYEEVFARKLVEDEKELRNESTGIRSYFPLNWKVPNILNSSGFGGGFVKKITLVNLPYDSNLNTRGKSVGFIVEIQNPIICTENANKGIEQSNDESDDDEDEIRGTEVELEENSEICPPFNNIDLIKGFRIIWYPYNSFSSTNYRNTEILLENVPKYNFKASSYDYESNDNDNKDKSDTIGKIFVDYLKEHNSEESDYAYYLEINCNCTINQQYTFKFSIIHHNNIQNSVFIPPFGFNVTVQDYSLTWFRLLKSEDRKIRDLTEKVCNGKIKIFPNNTGILLWDKSMLKSTIGMSLGYIVDFGDNNSINEEWELSESSYLDLEDDNDNIKRLISLRSYRGDDGDGVLSYFSFNKSKSINDKYDYGLEIPEKLPSKLKIRFIIRILNTNYETYQCKSRVYETFEGVPTSPLNLEYIPLTYDSIKLSWETPLSDGGYKITEYEIILTPSIMIDESKSKIDKIVKKSKNSFLVIENLIPTVTYKCEVMAINKIGSGRVAYIGNITSKKTSKETLGTCSNLSVFRFVIDENTNKEMSWWIHKELYNDLSKVYIYTYCVKDIKKELWINTGTNGGIGKSYELIFIHKGKSLCRETKEGLKCTFLEKVNDNTFKELNCESFSFKVIEKQSNDTNKCIMNVNSDNMRLLYRHETRAENIDDNIVVRRYLSLKHMLLKEDYKMENTINSGGSLVHYPIGYNPNWDNGLNKIKMRIGILNPNTTFIYVKVNYIYDLNGFEDLIAGNETENTYFYDLKSNRGDNGLMFKNTWSLGIRNIENNSYGYNHNSSKNKSSSDLIVEIMILNLIPDMTGLITIDELDENRNKKSTSKHIIRIPRRIVETNELKIRRLLNINELLSVNLTSIISNIDYFGFVNNRLFSRFRQLKNTKNTYFNNNNNGEYVELDMRIDSKNNEHLSNSLFVSSKIIIDNWPEDYERRIFDEIGIKINSGNLIFKNTTEKGENLATNREISGIVSNYKPLSELSYYNNNNDSISALFDGDRNTKLEYYKSENTENNDSSFPHIKLSFKEPVCVLFIRLNWEIDYSPISTVTKVKVRSSNESKTRDRIFNPMIHNCDSEKEFGERIDTIQILPPEEMVNTYFTNPLNRYPSIHEITLHFVGSCRNRNGMEYENNMENELELFLSLIGIEIVPCITNDLVISYSDPLSQRNNSLVNTNHRIEKSHLMDKYTEIQKKIIENIDKEQNKSETLLLKYKNNTLDKSNIYLDLNTILSEENVLRSFQIPKKRILIQNTGNNDHLNETVEPKVSIKTSNRRLIHVDYEKSVSFVYCLIYNWLDLTIIFVLNYAMTKSRSA